MPRPLSNRTSFVEPPPGIFTRRKGDEGERLAAVHLKKLGYKIIDTNFHCRTGEVDIIARHGQVLVFVEDKARSSERFGTAFEAVDTRKQRRIISAARQWIAAKRLSDVAIRFDVVAVDMGCNPPSLEVLEAAFDT